MQIQFEVTSEIWNQEKKNQQKRHKENKDRHYHYSVPSEVLVFTL